MEVVSGKQENEEHFPGETNAAQQEPEKHDCPAQQEPEKRDCPAQQEPEKRDCPAQQEPEKRDCPAQRAREFLKRNIRIGRDKEEGSYPVKKICTNFQEDMKEEEGSVRYTFSLSGYEVMEIQGIEITIPNNVCTPREVENWLIDANLMVQLKSSFNILLAYPLLFLYRLTAAKDPTEVAMDWGETSQPKFTIPFPRMEFMIGEGKLREGFPTKRFTSLELVLFTMDTPAEKKKRREPPCWKQDTSMTKVRVVGKGIDYIPHELRFEGMYFNSGRRWSPRHAFDHQETEEEWKKEQEKRMQKYQREWIEKQCLSPLSCFLYQIVSDSRMEQLGKEQSRLVFTIPKETVVGYLRGFFVERRWKNVAERMACSEEDRMYPLSKRIRQISLSWDDQLRNQWSSFLVRRNATDYGPDLMYLPIDVEEGEGSLPLHGIDREMRVEMDCLPPPGRKAQWDRFVIHYWVMNEWRSLSLCDAMVYQDCPGGWVGYVK
jgi:hypothetical protein